MNRVVLMLAFHFPPFAQSTGGQRVLSFARQLPDHGWTPVVLTASEDAYQEIDRGSLAHVPPELEVVRAWVVDVGRRIAVRGHYPGWLATPDRWATWVLGACRAGLRVIKKQSPAVLWATFPIPSVLLAAALLHRLAGVPLVVDLRDPVVHDEWPATPRLRLVYGWIERLVVNDASAVVVTTPGALKLYTERYPGLPASRFHVIPNGIDDIASITPPHERLPVTDDPVTLVHSGLMELPDRDPSEFFSALRNMFTRGEIDPSWFRVILRASGQEAEFRRRIDDLGIGAIVTLAPRLPRQEAIAELRTATGLLLFQGEPCNRQIPAKAYEYLASRKPILGICHPAGDTYDLLRSHWSVPYLADLADHEQIQAMLTLFINDVRSHTTFIPAAELLIQHSRAAAARQLADLLNEIASIGSDRR
jgi:glycosyltransferase involved in cell wall biosynthesis